MVWTANGLVPAKGYVPSAETQPGAVQDVPEKVAEAPVFVVPVKLGTAVNPKNVVALAKARLREVKSELRRLKALEKEKGELERLIAAAVNKPQKTNIREIKRNAG